MSKRYKDMTRADFVNFLRVAYSPKKINRDMIISTCPMAQYLKVRTGKTVLCGYSGFNTLSARTASGLKHKKSYDLPLWARKITTLHRVWEYSVEELVNIVEGRA